MSLRTILAGGAFAALSLSLASPASAVIFEVNYSGVVVGVFNPATADGVVAGDIAHVRLRFDPAALHDITAAANAAYSPPTLYTNLQAAKLVGPDELLEVTIGANHFTAADQFGFLPDPGFGTLPAVLFNDGVFFGVQFFGLNGGFSTFVTSGAAPEPFDFVGGDFAAGGPSYVGYFDYTHAVFTPVPEPATWALMICGFGMAGAVLRRRARGFGIA